MKLSCHVAHIARSEPFLSNKGSLTAVSQLMVRLTWRDSSGVGTAVPAKEYGMTLETIQAALDTAAPLLADASPFELERLLGILKSALPGQASAVAAIDMALHDLLGQITGLSLRQLWGLDGLVIGPTGLSLGVLPLPELMERARQHAEWPILKLKMMADTDPASILRLREVYAGRLWVDGNGAWSPEQAVAAAGIFADAGVELLEQPVPAGDPEALRFVRERSTVAIVADEDCHTPADVLRLKGCVDGINIKLLKCGGLRWAREMIALARQLGMKVMLGCKTESALGITAMAQLAGLADYLDLDGALALTDDPYAGVTIRDGWLTLPEGPGFGVTARPLVQGAEV